MVLISHLYKFIHIRNYKVASSSVESFFGQFCIDSSTKSDYEFDDLATYIDTSYGIIIKGCNMSDCNIHTHMNAYNIVKMVGENIFNTYTKFCIVRNPYDRIISFYYYMMENFKNIDMSLFTQQKLEMDNITQFRSFCKEIINPESPTSNHIKGILIMKRIMINEQPVCDYYIRYEHLKEDIITLLDKLGITDYDIDKLPNHKSGIRPKDKHYREYYDDETREIVYQLCKKEFDMFGYTF